MEQSKMNLSKMNNQLKNITNQLLKKFKKENYKDNISCADLADVQLISKFNKEVCFFRMYY